MGVERASRCGLDEPGGDEMSSSSRKYSLSFLQMYFSTLDSISSPPRPERKASKGKEEPPEEQLHLLFNLFFVNLISLKLLSLDFFK